MQEPLTKGRLEQLRRDARKQKKVSGTPYVQLLNLSAHSMGFADWADLHHQWEKSLSAPASTTEPYADPILQISQALETYLRQCSNNDVLWLCRGGTLWVRPRDLKNGDLSALHFEVMGALDRATQDEADNTGLLLSNDFEGFPDRFVFDGDEDDEGNPLEPQEGVQEWYSHERGREMLLAEVEDLAIDAYHGSIEHYLAGD
ncbi:MAG: hypothetical protein AB3X37_04225 [Leptothrix ochracea]|uniref:hypothetical protein n=1 Tax=Leptothrix ochracea TaxID=735331 RepID=UPI0034E1B769